MSHSTKSVSVHRDGSKNGKYINFEAIKQASSHNMVAILYRFFPEGRIRGKEFLAKNPKRNDKSLGSFSINLNSGVWCDFTTNDRGGDLISLTAYLYDLSQGEAAKRLAQMVGVEV